MPDPGTASVTRQRPVVLTPEGMVTTRWSNLGLLVVGVALAAIAWWQLKSDTAQALAEVRSLRADAIAEAKALRADQKPYQDKVDRLWLLYELTQGRPLPAPLGIPTAVP